MCKKMWDDNRPYGIPKFEYGTTELYQQNEIYIIKATDTSPKDYDNYFETLLAAGYTIYAENKIENNTYVTLVNEDTKVTLYHIANDCVTRIIAEPRGAMYPRLQENVYEPKNIQSLFTGVQGDMTVCEEGMGFVIRLCDGSFIVIDGGIGDPLCNSSKNFIKILKEQSPVGQKPIIAAWVFTHCHGDHIGMFNIFSMEYHDEVVIERFYYNFPTEADIMTTAAYMLNEDDVYRYPKFKSVMADYYADVPTITPHTGDKYFIRNAVIDVIFTYEDHLPDTIAKDSINNMNESSTIFKINIDGQTMLIAGDADKRSLAAVLSGYDSFLKSDFVQMPHHGLTKSVDFYRAVDPQFAILSINHPRCEYLLNGGGAHEANRWLVESENVRQIIEFGKGNVTIPMPYNPSDQDIDRIPNANTVYKVYPLD